MDTADAVWHVGSIAPRGPAAVLQFALSAVLTAFHHDTPRRTPALLLSESCRLKSAPRYGGRLLADAGSDAVYRKILVPLDGSELSLKALPHALAIATVMRAEVVLLRAIARLAKR